MKKLYIIDDSDFDHELVRAGLEKATFEYEAYHALSLDEIDLEKAAQVDLVLSDLNLIGHDKIQTLTRLVELFPHAKKAIMSGVEPLGLDELIATYKLVGFVNKDDIVGSLAATLGGYLA